MLNHNFNQFPELTNAQLRDLYFQSPHKQILYSFWGTCSKVVDGDTLHVSTSFRDFDTVVRFSNKNAPEMNEGGDTSKQWLREQIEGKEIYVVVDYNNRVGKYGRILGTIIQGGCDINELSDILGMSTEFSRRNDGVIPDPFKAEREALKIG